STTVPAFAALFIRWLSISLLIAYTISRRTLTPWVLVSLLAGAELGHDWPSVAMQLQFLGAIFIRLIKAIVAPLLFSTLVVGIAGHGDLRKVRRLGIKSLVYFEIVSTIAMLLGFAAINISRAGESIQGFATTVTRSTAATYSATEIITEIFPENIAKSVAENHVLQIVVFAILFGIALALVPEKSRAPFLKLA